MNRTSISDAIIAGAAVIMLLAVIPAACKDEKKEKRSNNIENCFEAKSAMEGCIHLCESPPINGKVKQYNMQKWYSTPNVHTCECTEKE